MKQKDTQRRLQIEQDVILQEQLAKANFILPKSAIKHGKHKPYALDWEQDNATTAMENHKGDG